MAFRQYYHTLELLGTSRDTLSVYRLTNYFWVRVVITCKSTHHVAILYLTPLQVNFIFEVKDHQAVTSKA